MANLLRINDLCPLGALGAAVAFVAISILRAWARFSVHFPPLGAFHALRQAHQFAAAYASVRAAMT
ncbi:exported hypothetical protein [Bradyrhizobium sp. STM 3843]|nr:exported hypothetical protein [Bradyrhizobium sp. STM 3843]